MTLLRSFPNIWHKDHEKEGNMTDRLISLRFEKNNNYFENEYVSGAFQQ